MPSTVSVVVVLAIGLVVASGCQSAQARKLLSAPTGTITTAVQHHEAGILAYEQNQWPQASVRRLDSDHGSPQPWRRPITISGWLCTN